MSGPGHKSISCRVSWAWSRSFDINTGHGYQSPFFAGLLIKKVMCNVDIGEPRVVSQEA